MNYTLIQDNLVDLFETFFMEPAQSIEKLPVSGSARVYYRIYGLSKNYIATWNADVNENEMFFYFTEHFKKNGVNVPCIYVISEDRQSYIQDDLGDKMLIDYMLNRDSKNLNEYQMSLYCKAIDKLIYMQIKASEGLDYSNCIPRPVFDRTCVMWDLYYFKYCYLRLAGAVFSENELERDFVEIADVVCSESPEYFMFRDFQSRNIMISDDDVYFIDYQGGRQGALQYDLASLLYDAIVEIPTEQKKELLEYYISRLSEYRIFDKEDFRNKYYYFVLLRLLQAMGAFGLRGLYEGKSHFIDSINPCLRSIIALLDDSDFKGGKSFKTLENICKSLCSQL